MDTENEETLDMWQCNSAICETFLNHINTEYLNDSKLIFIQSLFYMPKIVMTKNYSYYKSIVKHQNFCMNVINQRFRNCNHKIVQK